MSEKMISVVEEVPGTEVEVSVVKFQSNASTWQWQEAYDWLVSNGASIVSCGEFEISYVL
jgi:hypothetical protein